MEKNYIKETISLLIVVIVSLFGLWLVYKTTDIGKKLEIKIPEIEELIITEEKIEEQKKEQKQEKEKYLSDFDKYKDYKQLSIYPNGIITPSNYINNAEKSLIRASRAIKITGKIQDAFIYIKAGVNSPFVSLTNNDTLYFYLVDGRYQGGHLDIEQSKLLETTSTTEVLYNLKRVPLSTNLDNYVKNKIEYFNFLDSLNKKEKYFIASLVSTERYGKVVEMVLAYQCIDNMECEILLDK